MIHLINRPELVGKNGYAEVAIIAEPESERTVAFVCRDRSGASLMASVTAEGLNLFVQRNNTVESVIHVPGDMVLDFASWVIRSHLKASRFSRRADHLAEIERKTGLPVGVFV